MGLTLTLGLFFASHVVILHNAYWDIMSAVLLLDEVKKDIGPVFVCFTSFKHYFNKLNRNTLALYFCLFASLFFTILDPTVPEKTCNSFSSHDRPENSPLDCLKGWREHVSMETLAHQLSLHLHCFVWVIELISDLEMSWLSFMGFSGLK